MFVDEYVFSLYHYGQQTLNYCRLHNLPRTIFFRFFECMFNVIAKLKKNCVNKTLGASKQV